MRNEIGLIELNMIANHFYDIYIIPRKETKKE